MRKSGDCRVSPIYPNIKNLINWWLAKTNIKIKKKKIKRSTLSKTEWSVVQLIPICRNGDVRNVSAEMCPQVSLKSAFASAQPDQSLRCPHKDIWLLLLPKVLPAKIYMTKTSLFKHTEHFITKHWKFSDKNSDHIFSYFCSKHRLWVLVRTTSPRRC